MPRAAPRRRSMRGVNFFDTRSVVLRRSRRRTTRKARARPCR